MASIKARGSEAAPRGRRPASNERTITHALAVRSLATGGDDRAAPTWASFVNSFASQDWLLIGYLVAILVALAFGKGTNRSACIVRVSADLGAFLFVVALVRLQILRWGGAAGSLLYRFTIVATLLGTFFQLREILPAVSPWALDARIYAFDLQVFGIEPSLWFERFVTEGTTEWFRSEER